MSSISLLLYSRTKKIKLTFDDTDIHPNLTADIKDCITRKCDVEHSMANRVRVVNSNRTQQEFANLEKKYIALQQIKGLTRYLANVVSNDCFYVLDEEKSSWVDRKTAIECLDRVPIGKGFTRTHNDSFVLFSSLNFSFECYSFGYDDIPVKVGEQDKSIRICRFCGKSGVDRFKHVSHAIQDSLGNKILTCLEECDECNNDLGAIEDNFLALMDVRRALYSIPRKHSGKCPNIIGTNYVIQPDADGKPEVFLMKEYAVYYPSRTDLFKYKLNHKKSITNEGLYKALVKMVMDLIPSDILSNFSNTIKWLQSNGSWASDALPSIYYTILNEGRFFKQPSLDIYVNKYSSGNKGPYCTAMLWIYDMVYMFIVPFVNIDAGLYKYDYDLVDHWNFLKSHYEFKWFIQDSYGWHQSLPWVYQNFNLADKNVHVLPKNDPIFDESNKLPREKSDYHFPEFVSKGISVKKVNKASFKPLYNGKPLNAFDLRDITQQLNGPVLNLDVKHGNILFTMSVLAKDTTDTISYFIYEVKILFHLNHFSRYCRIRHNHGRISNFAFDFHLRDYLFDRAIRILEAETFLKRKGTDFEKCTALKIIESSERILSHTKYIIPVKGKPLVISDSMIHGIEYK